MKNEINKMNNEINKMIIDIKIMDSIIKYQAEKKNIDEKYTELNIEFDKITNIYDNMVNNLLNSNVMDKIKIYKRINDLFENAKKISTNINEVFDNYITSIGLTSYEYKYEADNIYHITLNSAPIIKYNNY